LKAVKKTVVLMVVETKEVVMDIETNFIAGISLGVEYVKNPDTDENHIVVDLFFLRVLFSWL
jgi:hypothetical protein